MTPAAAERGARVFRRSLGARMASLVAFLLFAAAAASRAAVAEFGAGFAITTGLALAAAAAMAGAFGDRVTLDDQGVTWSNAALRLLAGRRSAFGTRRLAWADIARVREHRPALPFSGAGGAPALFLIPHRGRRLVLDALQDFDEVRRRVEAGISSRSGDPPR